MDKRSSDVEVLVLQTMQYLVNLHRSIKIALLVAMDAMLCIAAVWISFSLRLGEWRFWDGPILTFSAVAIACWLPIFAFRGIYRSVIRFIGSRTVLRISSSCVLIMFCLVFVFGVSVVEGRSPNRDSHPSASV